MSTERFTYGADTPCAEPPCCTATGAQNGHDLGRAHSYILCFYQQYRKMTKEKNGR